MVVLISRGVGKRTGTAIRAETRFDVNTAAYRRRFRLTASPRARSGKYIPVRGVPGRRHVRRRLWPGKRYPIGTRSPLNERRPDKRDDQFAVRGHNVRQVAAAAVLVSNRAPANAH